ncbi:hypothetical protein Cme02nite_53370 [Catellatospora methionotrophica]|uniref:DUF916 domain-containing protein n=1 Tax=Catellatospora methionotrophica TaxID=121620 RepID=A0A8J3LM06_9ACTN|nr:DUF916 domain-containing protein [Catellatospora methionotrophica]GIG17005.1 hypothetical protein Cme02nite_53370 [Catellatospora methionotrophica]
MHASAPRRRLTRLLTAALTLLAALAMVGLGSDPALAADGDVAWTVRTASNAYGADRSSYSYSVNPGGTVTDALVVANRGPAPLDLAVYAADGFTTGAGQLDLLPKDGKSVAVGAWLHADRSSVVLEPGASVQVPFKVTVPANATPGDYVGGIVSSLTQSSDAAGINVDRRLGIRVKLRVGGELKPGLTVEDLSIAYAGTAHPLGKGDATVTYRIHNTGNAMLSAQQAVSVAGPFGRLRADAAQPAPSPQLLPGESWQVSVPVHGVAPTVRLTATVTLTPLLVDASGTTSPLAAVEATAGGWAVPWTLLLLIVVLIAAAVGVRVLSRRGRAQRERREDARVQEAVEQALRDKDQAEG